MLPMLRVLRNESAILYKISSIKFVFLTISRD